MLLIAALLPLLTSVVGLAREGTVMASIVALRMAHTIVHTRRLLKNAFPGAAVQYAMFLVLALVGNLGSAASPVAHTYG